MAPEELANEIVDYITRAEALEKVRKDLVERLGTVMREEIIPQVEPLLPDHYNISKERSKVDVREDETGSVPVKFHLSLRLLYDGKPITPRGVGMEQLGDIQRQLTPKLEEIAEKCGIERVMVMVYGEPAHIG